MVNVITIDSQGKWVIHVISRSSHKAIVVSHYLCFTNEQGYKVVWLDWDASQASLLLKPTLSPFPLTISVSHLRIQDRHHFFSCLCYTRRNLNAKQRSLDFMVWTWTIVGIVSEYQSEYIAKQWVRLYQQCCLGDATMEFSLSKWAILFSWHWWAWALGSLVVVDVILLFECWGYFFVHVSQCFLGS